MGVVLERGANSRYFAQTLAKRNAKKMVFQWFFEFHEPRRVLNPRYYYPSADACLTSKWEIWVPSPTSMRKNIHQIRRLRFMDTGTITLVTAIMFCMYALRISWSKNGCLDWFYLELSEGVIVIACSILAAVVRAKIKMCWCTSTLLCWSVFSTFPVTWS